MNVTAPVTRGLFTVACTFCQQLLHNQNILGLVCWSETQPSGLLTLSKRCDERGWVRDRNLGDWGSEED